MNKINYIVNDQTLLISITTNYKNKSTHLNGLLNLSVKETDILIKDPTENLEWSKHPLYQWGQRKIGNI